MIRGRHRRRRNFVTFLLFKYSIYSNELAQLVNSTISLINHSSYFKQLPVSVMGILAGVVSTLDILCLSKN